MSTTMRIGFCGLGKMGLPMARRLIDAGHRVAVWNRTHEKARALGAASALCIACEMPEEVARESDVVLLCLADGVAVEDVAFGPHGLAMGARRKALTIVDHSTLAPSQTRSLAARWRDLGQPIPLSVMADKRLEPGSCVCESDFGTVDASLDTQLRAMRSAVSRALKRSVEEADAQGEERARGDADNDADDYDSRADGEAA